MKISEINIARIKKLCEKYEVRTFAAFGSIVRDDFDDSSDIDFVLQRHIDLVEERAIKNKYFKKELDDTKVLIYG